MKTQPRVVIQMTLNGILFIANGKSAQILSNRITLDSNDPVLDAIASELEVTTKDLLDVLEIFFKFFPVKRDLVCGGKC